MIAGLLCIIAISLIFYSLYKRITRNNDYFKKRGIPQLNLNFLVGDTFGFMLLKRYNGPEFVKMLYNKFPNEKICGFFHIIQPIYVIRDPDIIKTLIIKDFDYFPNHSLLMEKNLEPLFKESLVFSKNQKWRDMRCTITPAFTGSKMRQMFELVSEASEDMAKHFITQAGKEHKLNYEMKDLFSRYANDIVATCAYGIKVNSFEDPKNEFLITGRRLTYFFNLKTILKVFAFIIAPTLTKYFDIHLMDKKASDFFKSMIINNMEQREKNKIYRPDLIDILMHVRRGNYHWAVDTEEKPPNKVEESNNGNVGVKRAWTDNEIIAQGFLFYLIIYETISTTLSLLAYKLATHPDIQQKLYNEIDEINRGLNGGRLTYDALHKMRYMDQVINETLRMHPTAFFIDRVCTKNYEFDDGDKLKFQFEKGSSFWIPVQGLHYDPQYFPDPEKFDPERFSEENKDKIVYGTFLPFGIGPRACIGYRFAFMMIRAAIYNIVLNFELHPNNKTQIPLVFKKGPAALSCEQGVHLELKLRRKENDTYRN